MKQEENLKDIMRKYAKLQTESLTTIDLRDLSTELTDYLHQSRKKEDFTVALIYKNLIEDLLKNLSEDDYLKNHQAEEIIKKINSSINYFVEYEKNREGWLEMLFDVCAEYQKIPSMRHTQSEIFLAGPKGKKIKVFVADSDSDKIFFGRHLDYEFFPNLDENLSDPDFSKSICNWYIDTLLNLKKTGEINTLCMVEKEFSSVGSLVMMSQLVYELELPAAIYRKAYWDVNAKVGGTTLTPDSKVAIVYDVIYSGRVLTQVVQFLKEYFGTETKAAVVFFDFEKAQASMEQMSIDLYSYLKFSEVEEQVKAKLPLVKECRQIKNKKGNYEERKRDALKILEEL